ncbi:MAG: hypothetical protein WB646_19035 [Steroidobacteraceae bacterium]
MGELLYFQTRSGKRSKQDWARVAADFMEWMTPTLDAAHVQRHRRRMHDGSIIAPGGYSPRDLARLRDDIREAMTALYLQHHDVAAATLRLALDNIAAVNPPIPPGAGIAPWSAPRELCSIAPPIGPA